MANLAVVLAGTQGLASTEHSIGCPTSARPSHPDGTNRALEPRRQARAPRCAPAAKRPRSASAGRSQPRRIQGAGSTARYSRNAIVRSASSRLGRSSGRPSRDECVRGGAVGRRRYGPATRMSPLQSSGVAPARAQRSLLCQAAVGICVSLKEFGGAGGVTAGGWIWGVLSVAGRSSRASGGLRTDRLGRGER